MKSDFKKKMKVLLHTVKYGNFGEQGKALDDALELLEGELPYTATDVLNFLDPEHRKEVEGFLKEGVRSSPLKCTFAPDEVFQLEEAKDVKEA